MKPPYQRTDRVYNKVDGDPIPEFREPGDVGKIVQEIDEAYKYFNRQHSVGIKRKKEQGTYIWHSTSQKLKA